MHVVSLFLVVLLLSVPTLGQSQVPVPPPETTIIASRDGTAANAGVKLQAVLGAIATTGQTVRIQGDFSLANARLVLDNDRTQLIGMGGAKITLASSGKYEEMCRVSADYCLVEGIEFDWNDQAAPSDSQAARCVHVTGDYNVVRTCTSRNTPGAAGTGVAQDFDIGGNYNKCIQCRSFNSGRHAFVDSGDHNVVKDVYAQGCDENSAYSTAPPVASAVSTLDGLRGTSANGAFNFNGNNNDGEETGWAIVRNVHWVSTGNPLNNAKITRYLNATLENVHLERASNTIGTSFDLRIDTALTSLSVRNCFFDGAATVDDCTTAIFENDDFLSGFLNTRAVLFKEGTYTFDNCRVHNLGYDASRANGVAFSASEQYTRLTVTNCELASTRTYTGGVPDNGSDYGVGAPFFAPGNTVWCNNTLINSGTAASVLPTSDSVYVDICTQKSLYPNLAYDDGTMTVPPTTKTWPAGYIIIKSNGIPFRCVTAGTPGTWYESLIPLVVNDISGGTLGTSDVCGQIYTNTGASGGQTFNLPPVTAGMKVTFCLTASDDVNVNPDNSDQIILTGSGELSAGSSITSDAVQGSFVTLIGIDTTHWMMTESAGKWRDGG